MHPPGLPCFISDVATPDGLLATRPCTTAPTFLASLSRFNVLLRAPLCCVESIKERVSMWHRLPLPRNSAGMDGVGLPLLALAFGAGLGLGVFGFGSSPSSAARLPGPPVLAGQGAKQ